MSQERSSRQWCAQPLSSSALTRDSSPPTKHRVNRRLAIIAAIYLGALPTAAAVFDFAEGKDLWSSAWWEVVTATTVGYGDLSPTALVGRVVAIVLMHLTTLLVMPLLTAEIAAKLIVNSDAFTHDEQEEIKLTLRRLEAKVDAMAGALGEAARTPPAPGSASEGR
jgi:voltage-gated potassium channel